MTVFIISLFALLFLAALALPFIMPSIAEPLANQDDPVKLDLEEERDALATAIRELSSNTDLTKERQQTLQNRYEAKLTQVLKKLDTYQQPAVPKKRNRLPASWALLGLLTVPSIALLGNYVLPRIGQGGTVTTNRASDIARGRELQKLERAVRDNPTEESMLALAESYWQLANESIEEIAQSQGIAGVDREARYLEQTQEVYTRITEVINPAPSIAFRRLGFLSLMRNDPEAALPFLEKAVAIDPTDTEAQYSLGEVQYYFGNMTEAAGAFKAFQDIENDPNAQRYLEAAQKLEPFINNLKQNRSTENLLALADTYWELEERNRAANLYAEVVLEAGVEDAKATSRIGQTIFFNGDTQRAIAPLERANGLDPNDLDTLLFLGNAYFSLGENQLAIDAWKDYVIVSGGEALAGRVPQLIAQAQAKLDGIVGEPLVAIPLTGAQLYAANCSGCHGINAQGGSGPRLVDNQRLTDLEMVKSTIQYGRGMMPGFGALLSESELNQLVAFLAEFTD